MSEIQKLKERLSDLDDAMATGEARIKDSDGKEVWYRSISQIKEARREVIQQLRDAEAAAAGSSVKRRKMAIRTTPSRGL